MAQVDDLKKLYSMLEDARAHRQTEVLKNAERNLEYYRGNQWRQKPKSGVDPVTVNWVGSGIFRKFAMLASAVPKFKVIPLFNVPSPLKEVVGEMALDIMPTPNTLETILTKAVQKLFVSSGAWDAARAALLDRFIYGYGCVYTGWDARLGPVGYRVAPHQFLWDPQRSWHDWYRGMFAARAYRAYLAEVKRHPGWQNTRDLTPSEPGQWDLGWQPSRGRLSQAEEVTIIEAWFRNVQVGRNVGDYRIIWAAGRPDKPLLIQDWPIRIRGRVTGHEFPFFVVAGHPVPDKFGGLSDIDVTKDVQDELNQLRSYSKARALLALKMYTRHGVLDREGLEKLASPVIGEVVQGAADANTNPITFLPGPPYSMDLMQAGGDVMRDIAVLQGIDDTVRGIQAPRRQTATEAQLLASRSQSIMNQEQAMFEQLCSDTAGALWQVAVEFQHVGWDATTPAGAVTIGLEHLIPAEVSVLAGSSRAEREAEQLQALTSFTAFLVQTGLLRTPANPAGVVDGTWLALELASKLGIELPAEALSQPQELPPPGTAAGQEDYERALAELGAENQGPAEGTIPPEAGEMLGLEV